MKRNYFINSFIVGFLLNGLLINGFCIYTALVFNEGDSLINKVLFLICGILFLIFLFKKSINVIRGLKVGTSKIGNVIKENVITVIFSILWMVLFWVLLELVNCILP